LKPERARSKAAASPARIAAFDILLKVAQKHSYASELLHSRTHQDLSPADHGLATELVMGVLRWMSALDDRIAQVSAQPLAKLDIEVLIAIRLAVYQLIYLDRIPASAAVNDSVQLVKRARKHSAAPFVNAVLRKIGKASSPPGSDRPAFNSSVRIAKHFSHPHWIVERWVSSFGLETAQKICEYDQRRPDTSIRISQSGELTELKSLGIELEDGRLLQAARVVRSGNLTSLPPFREGRITIQDEASQLVALLLGRGDTVLDCCAAPGGKTRIIAQQDPSSSIVAAELHPHRARLLRKLVRDKNVTVVAADARTLPLVAKFDRVLVDVPCSGTGTLARNPDIKWRLRSEDLADLQKRQVAILNSALDRVAHGGKLVYASCSLEAEENESVVDNVLKDRHSFRIRNASSELTRLKNAGELVIEDLASLTRGPYLRTIPGIHPCDGFFAAVLERTD